MSAARCGSSAAALLAGVLLANHFGNLNWTSQQILEEACRRLDAYRPQVS